MIDPAGEMWSVVIESPTFTRTRAPSMSPPAPACVELVEERRLLDVGRRRIPRVHRSGRRRQRTPSARRRPRSARTPSRTAPGHGRRRSASTTSSGAGQMSAEVDGPVGARGRSARSSGRRRRAPPARTRRRAAARRGRTRAPVGGCAPRSCGCPTAPRRRSGRPRPPRRPTSSISGPEFPMHVVQPYPTSANPSFSRYGVRPARSR